MFSVCMFNRFQANTKKDSLSCESASSPLLDLLNLITTILKD
jgi:hypothetical protein